MLGQSGGTALPYGMTGNTGPPAGMYTPNIETAPVSYGGYSSYNQPGQAAYPSYTAPGSTGIDYAALMNSVIGGDSTLQSGFGQGGFD